MKIQVENLVKTFGAARAVDGVSFSFESGNIVGFIGPNGAGKTTTIKVMSTLETPDSGDVLYDSVSVVSDPELVRRAVGYMPDSLPDYKDIQVWEYLDFFARSFGLKGEKRTKTLAEIEEFTALGGIRYKYLASLSKGMKQRVSLARSLVHNPPVLIMDEPAAGLDPRARLELRALLKVLSGQKKAILLSSHILSELQDICDSAVIIEKGRLLSAGKIGELLENAVGAKHDAPQDSKPHFALLVRCPSDAAEAVRRKVLEHPAVRGAELRVDGELAVTVEGTDSTMTEIVGTLFAAKLPVTGFHREELGLEEVFMKITTGGVQ